MKWFHNISTIEELRRQYRELLKKYHPDNPGGSVKATQDINEEYNILFERLKERNQEEGKSYTYEENEAFQRILNQIIGYDMTIEIIGTWIWCFESYSYREKLKELGFTWCHRKKAWVWHEEPYRKRGKEEIPMEQIRNKYGSQKVKDFSSKEKRKRIGA